MIHQVKASQNITCQGLPPYYIVYSLNCKIAVKLLEIDVNLG